VNARREAWLKAPTAANEETRGGRSGAAELGERLKSLKTKKI